MPALFWVDCRRFCNIQSTFFHNRLRLALSFFVAVNYGDCVERLADKKKRKLRRHWIERCFGGPGRLCNREALITKSDV